MRMGIPEQTIKMMAWGTVTTEMLRVYAHLTPTDAEIEMNRWMGIKMENRINPLLYIDLPTECNCCGVINPKTNMFCGDCGNALSEEAKARSRFRREY
jgi:molybdenum cofactor biosynthesis enzyme MoaA